MPRKHFDEIAEEESKYVEDIAQSIHKAIAEKFQVPLHSVTLIVTCEDDVIQMRCTIYNKNENNKNGYT